MSGRASERARSPTVSFLCYRRRQERGQPIPVDSGGTGGIAQDPGALDAVERRFWHGLWQTAVPPAIEEYGVARESFGPVCAQLVVSTPRERRMNLVLGACEPGAVKEGHLEAALEWIEFFGVDYHVPVTPGMAEAEAAQELLASCGYEPDGRSVRFLRDASPPQLPAPPEVEAIELEDDYQQETFSEMIATGLGLESWEGTFFYDLALRPDWYSYMALIDEAPAAAAAMLVHDGVAGLCLATTKPLAEGFGCQAALLRRGILDAGAAGCRAVFLEIGESLAAYPAGLRPEILAAGFEESHKRPNWVRRR